MTELYDLVIIGGGVNGVGIARDAAGRGLKVLLCERADLASATSSASSKLIHGGLRYLEHYEFRLVRESLIEREVLLRAAPHIIWPLRFVLPYDAGMRPAWLLRLGLFIYDHIGGRKLLPPTRTLRLHENMAGKPLADRLSRGFEYSDCWVNDARLVVLNAIDAAERGAVIRTRCPCRGAHRVGTVWEITMGAEGSLETIQAKALVNAAGPWVQEMRNATTMGGAARGVRLVKGSHIVVPKMYPGPQAYTLQNGDGRIVFVIPYEGEFSLIGTTDLSFEGDPGDVAATASEKDYLCKTIGEYFNNPPSPDDIVWSYSGVRPLYDDGNPNISAVTRDFILDVDAPPNQAPALSIYGGKITTYRRLAEEVLCRLSPLMGWKDAAWTAGTTLPGGDMPEANFDLFLEDLARRYPFIPVAMRHRLARAYGTRVERIIGNAKSIGDLGQNFGGLLTEAELRYLKTHEWAQQADDVLWRRSKLGLHMAPESQKQVEAWFRPNETPSLRALSQGGD
jgi:glycerol-3-phosphate dehydrogenase